MLAETCKKIVTSRDYSATRNFLYLGVTMTAPSVELRLLSQDSCGNMHGGLEVGRENPMKSRDQAK